MKIKEIVSDIAKKEDFVSLKKKYPDIIFSAAFFSTDLVQKSNQVSLDFYIPKINRIAVFESPAFNAVVHEDEIKEMTEQKTDLKIDIDDLREEVKKIIEGSFKGFSPSRLIAVLKENVWSMTVMNNALGLIKIRLDAISGKKISAEKASFMDFARK